MIRPSQFNCSKCALSECRTRIVDGRGPASAQLMIVAESPDYHADRSGIPFVGQWGKLIRSILSSSGATADKVYVTNAVKCHPPENRDPTNRELDECLPWLVEEIEQVRPSYILCLGRFAMMQVQTALQYADHWAPAQQIYHPNYILRNPRKRMEWEGQIRQAVKDAGLCTEVFQIQPPRPIAPYPVPDWYEGIPDLSSLNLGVDTETESLEEGYGESLVTVQLSDGTRSALYAVQDMARLYGLEGASPDPSGETGAAGRPCGVGGGEREAAGYQGGVGAEGATEPRVRQPALLRAESRLPWESGPEHQGPVRTFSTEGPASFARAIAQWRADRRDQGADGDWDGCLTDSDSIRGVRELYQDRSAPSFLFHNAKYDLAVLDLDPYDFERWDDTILMAYVLRISDRLGLKILGPKVTGIPMTPITDLLRFPEERIDHKGRVKKITRNRTFTEALVESTVDARDYALKDPVVTKRLGDYLIPRLKADQVLWDYYNQIEKPLVPVLMKMERHGALIDPAGLRDLSVALAERRLEVQSTLDKWIPGVNIHSPKQLPAALLEMGVPLRNHTKTGAVSTDRPALLDACGVKTEADLPLGGWGPLVRAILDAKKVDTLKSTFVDKLPTILDRNSRLHTEFNQAGGNNADSSETGPGTGRLSSRNPNLQNIPARDPIAWAIRRAFVAPPGYKIVKADYSQLELRIYAHYTQEEALVRAYQSGVDVHTSTAAQVYGVAVDQVTPGQRKLAKNSNFCIVYGGGPERLAWTAGVPLATAQETYFKVREAMASISRWPREVARQLEKCGYIETLLGWRNYYPLYWSPIESERSEAVRQAANCPIQGTASGIVKVLMVEMDQLIRREKWEAHLFLQVHDEVVYEVADSLVPEFTQALRELGAAVGGRYLTVPLILEVGVAENWKEAG